MIGAAWKDYRSWAALARQEQARNRRWTQASFSSAIVAATLGATAVPLHGHPQLFAGLSGLAALASALFAWLGREQLMADSQTRWLKARIVAEGIKSECYRLAGLAAPYSTENNAGLFQQRIDGLITLTKDAAISPIPVPTTDGGVAAPSAGMTLDWYCANRLDEQIGYFQRAKDRSERRLALLRWISFASMLAGGVCGFGAALGAPLNLAGWVGVATTFATSVAALGLADRAKALAASAAYIINGLSAVRRRAADSTPLPAIVSSAEDIINGENQNWLEIFGKRPLAITAVAAN